MGKGHAPDNICTLIPSSFASQHFSVEFCVSHQFSIELLAVRVGRPCGQQPRAPQWRTAPPVVPLAPSRCRPCLLSTRRSQRAFHGTATTCCSKTSSGDIESRSRCCCRDPAQLKSQRQPPMSVPPSMRGPGRPSQCSHALSPASARLVRVEVAGIIVLMVTS